MLETNRNSFVDGSWTLNLVKDSNTYTGFDCGDDDLNEYFHVDAQLHRQELLTQTYCLQLSEYPNLILALLDFCNDSVHFQKYKATIDIVLDAHKQHPYLPAVKLTRFGVQKQFQRHNIGSFVLNMVKKFFITDNRTGCRFITVDSYNKPEVLKFYEKNGFKPLTDKDKNKKTRALYFDLKRLISP